MDHSKALRDIQTSSLDYIDRQVLIDRELHLHCMENKTHFKNKKSPQLVCVELATVAQSLGDTIDRNNESVMQNKLGFAFFWREIALLVESS